METLLTILLLMYPNLLLEFGPVVPRSDFQESEIPINICKGVDDGGSRPISVKVGGAVLTQTDPVKSQRWVACRSVIALDVPTIRVE